MKTFNEYQQSKPTRLNCLQALSQEIDFIVKNKKSKKVKGQVFFISETDNRNYKRMIYLKLIISKMTDKQFSDLQRVLYLTDKTNQKDLF